MSALDGDGRGYVQVSTQRLLGRKLFLWGMGAGGRKWQQWLTEPGHAHLEIQAGLARTQMQHVPMPAHTDWQWLEGYGYLQADPVRVHGQDWTAATGAVEESLEALLPRARLEADLEAAQSWVDAEPEIMQHGAGWGALEAQRAQTAAAGKGRPFAAASLGPLQAPWLALLEDGVLPEADPQQEPTTYMAQPQWRQLLEDALAAGRGHHWYSWYQLGVLRYAGGDYGGAREAWETSGACCDTAWSRRNLAVLAREENRIDEAVQQYRQATSLRPDLLPLVWECGQCLLETLPSATRQTTRQTTRIRLLEGRAAMVVHDFARVGRLLQERLVIDDLREGERSLSGLWVEYHEQRLAHEAGVPVDDDIRARVKEEFPVPAHVDFRMQAEV